MNRRELLKQIAILTGAAVVGAEFFTGCKPGGNNGKFDPFPWPQLKSGTPLLNAQQIALLDEVGETIIPTTDSPGAKATKIGAFMNTMVSDCYNPLQQDAFTKGLTTINEACTKATGKSFMDCDAKQRHDFLVTLEKEAKAFNAKVDAEEKSLREKHDAENKPKPWSEQKEFVSLSRHYYTMMKQLTLWGYFSSKEGSTMALRHLPVPGKYDGAYPYKKGDKAWA